jgi:hypothetical protein
LLGDGTADAPGSAGDESDFVGEVHGYDFSGTAGLDKILVEFGIATRMTQIAGADKSGFFL